MSRCSFQGCTSPPTVTRQVEVAHFGPTTIRLCPLHAEPESATERMDAEGLSQACALFRLRRKARERQTLSVYRMRVVRLVWWVVDRK